MVDKIQSIRGMNDILPEESIYWQFIEETLRQLMSSYGYQEIRFPVVEKTALFKRSIGEVTDIVEKEMYSFTDRNGDSLSLRPEGTAVCVRAGIQQGILVNQQQRLWYMGPMFRHERPQKGRYRQFHQFGVEVFGLKGPDIDAELICLTARFWQLIGLSEHVQLQINSLGSSEARVKYKAILIDYLNQYKEQLDGDSLRRLDSNPLRILDSKNPAMQEIIAGAPQLTDSLDEESRQDFDKLCAYLDSASIKYQLNSRLVRGLDYYNKVVFEWVTDKLGAQGTVCAGGRYDGLVEQLGGRATPAVGFAMGLERLVSLVSENPPHNLKTPHAVLVMIGENAQTQGLAMAEKLRDAISGIRLSTICGGGSLKSQMKRADKSQAELALILADDEIESQSLSVKYLRKVSTGKENGPIAGQQTLPVEQVIDILSDLVK